MSLSTLYSHSDHSGRFFAIFMNSPFSEQILEDEIHESKDKSTLKVSCIIVWQSFQFWIADQSESLILKFGLILSHDIYLEES